MLRWCRVELCSGAGVRSICGTGVPVVVDRLWRWCRDVWLFSGAREKERQREREREEESESGVLRALRCRAWKGVGAGKVSVLAVVQGSMVQWWDGALVKPCSGALAEWLRFS